MAKPIAVREFGNQLAVLMDDGTRMLAYPTTGGLWKITGTPSNGGGGVPGGGGGTPGGASVVIYPTKQHTVVDYDGSFQGHKNRNPPSVNPGSDYAPLAIGSDVWAVADGVVTDSDNTNGGSGGRTVHIDHPALGTGSDYLHLSDATIVSAGQTVKQGQLIGKSGASGNGSDTYYGAHLHISYRTALGHAYTNYQSIDFDAYIKSLGIV